MDVCSFSITSDDARSTLTDSRARPAQEDLGEPRHGEERVEICRDGDGDDEVYLRGTEAPARAGAGEEEAAAGCQDSQVDRGPRGHQLPPVQMAARHKAGPADWGQSRGGLTRPTKGLLILAIRISVSSSRVRKGYMTRNMATKSVTTMRSRMILLPCTENEIPLCSAEGVGLVPIFCSRPSSSYLWF